MKPVTFLMPVYNCEKFIAQAIQSLLQQTYQNFDILIINDGSTDNTLTIIEQFQKIDPRIKFISRENRGLIASLNEALELIKTPYIARMDGDDLCHPQRLELQMQFMESHPEIGICGTNMKLFDKVNKEIHYPFNDA